MPGLRDYDTGNPIEQDGTDVGGGHGPAHVITPDQMPAFSSVNEIIDLTTTRQSIAFPSGAVTLSVSYRLEAGETATANQMAFYCLNAASDADAAGKLATPGARYVIQQGDDHILSALASDPITRLDVIANAAVGSEETRFTVVAGVL